VTILAPGQRIADRYQLERRIAVGGMGEVWEASDTRLGRSVAVKVLRPELSDDPEFLHRFRIEARTVASLSHSGIAAVHDYGEDGVADARTAYLVMELVRGEPLSAIIARGPLALDETLRIVEEAALALQAAHERGFVHRDVKPGNILVRTDGAVKLTDFGIAKAADAVPVTRSGMVMGTAHYIAPEQASGAEAGPAGDVYSLGIVGYECLAGHRPFRAESTVAVAMMQVRDAPPPLPATVPMPARRLIGAVLVKDPSLRYATGGELAAAVAAVRRGDPPPPAGSASAVVTSTPYRSRPAVGLTAPPRVPENEPAEQRGPRPAPIGGSAPSGPQPGTAASSGPLRLQPTAGPSRTVLLLLFVLLAVAALVVGAFVLRSAGEGVPERVDPTPQGAPASTVASREGVAAGPAAPGGPHARMIVIEAGPVNPHNRRSGARVVRATPHRAARPGMMTRSLDTPRNRQR